MAQRGFSFAPPKNVRSLSSPQSAEASLFSPPAGKRENRTENTLGGTKGGHGPEFSLTGRAGLFPSMYGPGRASPRAKNQRVKISVTGQE